MNKNKILALLVIIAVYCGPFGFLFFRDNGDNTVDSGGEMLVFLAWIVGMIVAFWIGVNEPFFKKKVKTMEGQVLQGKRQAA